MWAAKWPGGWCQLVFQQGFVLPGWRTGICAWPKLVFVSNNWSWWGSRELLWSHWGCRASFSSSGCWNEREIREGVIHGGVIGYKAAEQILELWSWFWRQDLCIWVTADALSHQGDNGLCKAAGKRGFVHTSQPWLSLDHRKLWIVAEAKNSELQKRHLLRGQGCYFTAKPHSFIGNPVVVGGVLTV